MSKKNNAAPDAAKEMSPITTPVTATAPVDGASTKPTMKLKPRYVTLKNALNQVVRLHILVDGETAEMKLEPRAETAIREDALTAQVHRLVAQGDIRIR